MVMGRAHTDGDLHIYLPKEKVLATGDAVVGWMPFLNDGYPEDWATASPRPRPTWRSSAGMSRYPIGQYRERIALNVQQCYNKVVKKM
jgi:glyoxylase-like metal-dependent hydrolase (beta-lactamase superfamily II)